jgi:hypothetical protein
MVILATVDSAEDGRREAYRAARLLHAMLAADTIERLPVVRRYVGSVLALHRGKGGRILLTSYLGDAAGAEGALDEAKKHFPRAVSVPVVMPKDPKDGMSSPFFRTSLLIVGSEKSYAAAVRAAQRFGRASGIAYSTQGMVFDKKRGLIFPDDFEDGVLAGQYAPRRYDEICDHQPCVTVERSEGYEGFRPGLYIVVAGIVGSEVDAAERLKVAKKIVPSAYIKATTLYMGCMH